MTLLIIFIIWLLLSVTSIIVYIRLFGIEQLEIDCLHTEVYHLGHYGKLDEYLIAELKLKNKTYE
jgi:hypothetical protein